MGLVTTLSIDIQHDSMECHHAESRDYLNVMLNVVMLSVVAPICQPCTILESKVRAYPSKATLSLVALLEMLIRLERLARNKHSSFLSKSYKLFNLF
jgi:hypothetical protein